VKQGAKILFAAFHFVVYMVSSDLLGVIIWSSK